MNKEILAISISAVLVVAMLMPPIVRAQAATQSESNALKNILGLVGNALTLVNKQINPTLDSIIEDLKFKKKFWEYEQIGVSISIPSTTGGVGVAVKSCNLNDPTACAFTVESIQTPAGVVVTEISVDDTRTSINENRTAGPSNVLVDAGFGRIGASHEVNIVFDHAQPGTVAVFEFNGEKPQGMELCTFGIDASGKKIGATPNPC